MNKPSLLLVPGSLCNGTLFREQIACFQSDYDITLADYGAYGSVEEMARHILAEAPDTFALAGLSLGGIIALEMMTQAAHRIERLALLDSNHRKMPNDKAVRRQQEIDMVSMGGPSALSALIEDRYCSLYFSPVHRHDPSLKKIVLDMTRATGVQVFINQWRAAINRPDYTQLLPDIDCPSLVLCGEDDIVCPPELHHDMANQIPGATLQLIAECGHLSTLEAPAAVNQALADWLR